MSMIIKPFKIAIRDIAKGYLNSDEEGVTAYNSKLNIRPKYQREFVYNESKRNAVIDTIIKGYPLNVMYWVQNEDGSFEVLDGQQRTISFCEFIEGNFSIKYKKMASSFKGLPSEVQEKILSYECQIYICEQGTTEEKLDWFRVINIAGEVLTPQELRNAFYTGKWLTSAKRMFSKSGCKAYTIASSYLKGSCIRQDYLERALSWISDGHIEEYMNEHRDDVDANELWDYFERVINWVKSLFPKYNKIMAGVDWGSLYNQYGQNKYDSKKLSELVDRCMQDKEVDNKKGIYEYVFDGLEKHLSLREFDESDKITMYNTQQGICPICGHHFEIEEMDAHHITQWADGGKTEISNGVMLCKECHHNKKLHHN